MVQLRLENENSINKGSMCCFEIVIEIIKLLRTKLLNKRIDVRTESEREREEQKHRESSLTMVNRYERAHTHRASK